MDIRSLITRLGYKVDTKGLKKGEKAVGNYARNVKRLAIGAVAAIGASIIGIGVASVKSAAEMDSLLASFEVMLGSADKARKIVADITDMSDVTPFQARDLANSARMMLNFGVATEEVMGNLQMLGDIAGNDKERLTRLTRAFGQISSAARLTGEDLNQLIDAGFNPLMVLAKRGGGGADAIALRYQALRKEMEKGQISAKMVKSAFKEVTSEGGRFFGNMKKQSETMGGLWSTFLGLVNRVRVMFGKHLEPVIKRVLQTTNKWLKDTVVPGTKAWLATLDPLIWAYEDLVFILKAIPQILKEVQAAFAPEIQLVKTLVSTVQDLAMSVFEVAGAFLSTGESMSVMGVIIDGITLAIKGWVAILKTAAAGFKEIKALLSGDTDLIAKIDAELKSDLANLFDPTGGDAPAADRIGALRASLTTGIGKLTSTLKARREVRVQNVNLKVEQKNIIKAPAAKDGTTGLSAGGLDAAMRKASTSLWAAQLNKLTTSAIGS